MSRKDVCKICGILESSSHLGTAVDSHSDSGHSEEESSNKESTVVSSWIPDASHVPENDLIKGPGEVLLYYCYCQILRSFVSGVIVGNANPQRYTDKLNEPVTV